MTLFIRISEGLVVPIGSTFEKGLDELTVRTPGHDNYVLTGAAADAVQGFLDARYEVHVNANGVLDIPAAWSGWRKAQQLLAPEAAIASNLSFVTAKEPLPFGEPSEPAFNWDRINKLTGEWK